MRRNGTMVGAATATGRTGNGDSSKGLPLNSKAARLKAAPYPTRSDLRVDLANIPLDSTQPFRLDRATGDPRGDITMWDESGDAVWTQAHTIHARMSKIDSANNAAKASQFKELERQRLVAEVEQMAVEIRRRREAKYAQLALEKEKQRQRTLAEVEQMAVEIRRRREAKYAQLAREKEQKAAELQKQVDELEKEQRAQVAERAALAAELAALEANCRRRREAKEAQARQTTEMEATPTQRNRGGATGRFSTDATATGNTTSGLDSEDGTTPFRPPPISAEELRALTQDEDVEVKPVSDVLNGASWASVCEADDQEDAEDAEDEENADDTEAGQLAEMEKEAQHLEIEALKAQITALEGRVTRRTTQRDEYKCHLKTTTDERDALQSLLKARDDDVASLHEEVTHLRSDLERANATIGELTSHRNTAEEVSSANDDVPLPIVPDQDVEVSKTVTDGLENASWASMCGAADEEDSEDTEASCDDAQTRPRGAWAIPLQLTGDKDTEPALLPRPATLSQNIQAKPVATPRQTSSRRGDTENEVRILRRPEAATTAERAVTDTPRHPRMGSRAPSRSVDATPRRKRRKGASTTTPPTAAVPATRGDHIFRQQASFSAQAYHILAQQFGRDRTFFHDAIRELRLQVAELRRQQPGHSVEAISASPDDTSPIHPQGGDQSTVDSRGSLTLATILETIPEEPTEPPTAGSLGAYQRGSLDVGANDRGGDSTMVTSVESLTADLQEVITSRVVDDRDASAEDSIDAQRKRIGPPSEAVQLMEASPSLRDEVLASIKVPSPVQGGTVHTLQCLYEDYRPTFAVVTQSTGDIRQIETNNQLESQDEGLPSKSKRKRRRKNRKRRRTKKGRKKKKCDRSDHSPATHLHPPPSPADTRRPTSTAHKSHAKKEFQALFNSAATKSLPVSGFDGPMATFKSTYKPHRQTQPTSCATRSEILIFTDNKVSESSSSTFSLDVSDEEETVSHSLFSFVQDLEADLDAEILEIV